MYTFTIFKAFHGYSREDFQIKYNYFYIISLPNRDVAINYVAWIDYKKTKVKNI